jgi:hypothetical protein
MLRDVITALSTLVVLVLFVAATLLWYSILIGGVLVMLVLFAAVAIVWYAILIGGY